MCLFLDGPLLPLQVLGSPSDPGDVTLVSLHITFNTRDQSWIRMDCLIHS